MFERLSDDIRKENIVLSPSALMEFAKSPKHYHAAYILKEKKQTDAMFDGELVHKIILESEKFMEKYAVLDSEENYFVTVEQIKAAIENLGEKPCKGKKEDLVNQLSALSPAAKIWDLYKKQMLEQDKRLVDAETYEKLTRIAQAARSHQWLSKTIPGSMIEQPAWFKHETGIYFSTRMDLYHPGLGASKTPVIVDVKKVRNANPMKFQRVVADMDLQIQAAVYVDCVKALTGREPHYAFALVEFDSPYIIEIAALDVGAIEAGRAQYNKLIFKYIECLETDTWPAYTNGICTNISLPSWKFEQIDYDSELELEYGINI